MCIILFLFTTTLCHAHLPIGSDPVSIPCPLYVLNVVRSAPPGRLVCYVAGILLFAVIVLESWKCFMYIYFISHTYPCILTTMHSSCPARAPAPNMMSSSITDVSCILCICSCDGLVESNNLVDSLNIPVVSVCILCSHPFGNIS